MVVPRILDAEEECVRCLMRPLMYSNSKKRLAPPAILPGPNKTKVSLLRLRYTKSGFDFCIHHGKSLCIKDNEFIGLAIITPNIISECNRIHKTQHPASSISAEIVYAPMSNGKYLDSTIVVDTEDTSIDLPMHADLTYNNITVGDVKTSLRMYANELLKRVRYAIYSNGGLMQWQ